MEADLLHNESKRKLEEHSTGLVKRIDIFHQQQKNIDRRLLIVTQSETSDDAVKKFDASMEKLRRLEVAKYYVDLLAHVDHLRYAIAMRPKYSSNAERTALKHVVTFERHHKLLWNPTFN